MGRKHPDSGWNLSLAGQKSVTFQDDQWAKNAVVVEVDPPNHYAPLKNAPGSPSDSPETVKRDISNMYADWLKQADVVVTAETPIEISPLFIDSPENVKQKIEKGKKLDQPTYWV